MWKRGGRWLHCLTADSWAGEGWGDGYYPAGWERWSTAALLGETTDALLGGRELDCWAGDCCPAGWERTTTLLDKRDVDDGCTAGLDDGCAAGWERIGLLGGRRVGRLLTCWVGEDYAAG